MLNFIAWFRKYVCKACYAIGAALMLLMVAIAFVQLVGRYLVGANFLWADEVTIFCLTYTVALCMPMLWIEHDNINMDLFSHKLSKKADIIWMAAVDVVSLVTSALLFYSSLEAAALHRGFVASYLGYDESVRYYFAILTFALLCVTVTLSLIEKVFALKQKGSETSDH